MAAKFRQVLGVMLGLGRNEFRPDMRSSEAVLDHVFYAWCLTERVGPNYFSSEQV